MLQDAADFVKARLMSLRKISRLPLSACDDPYDIDRKTPAGESVVEIPLDVLKEAVSALGW